MSQHGKALDEQTPLLPPGPTVVDAVDDSVRHVDANVRLGKDEKKKVSVLQGACCVVALGLLVFLQATNISLLTTTQSEIAQDLQAWEKTSWFTSAFLIASSSTSPLQGKLSQIFSPRVIIFVSTIITAFGSVIAGFAQTFEGFIAGRVVTGIGGAGIYTVSMIIVLEFAGQKRRGLFVGTLNAGFTIGVAIGASLAGALLPSVGWRALFWMQAPLAVAAGFTLFLCIPRDLMANKLVATGNTTLQRLANIDYFGAASLCASIVLLLFSLSSPKDIPILPIILGLIVLCAFVLNEKYVAKDPIIPISLLKSRGLLCTSFGTTGYMMARWAVLFYTPTYAIAVRGWSAASAGSILVPTNLGFAIGGLLAGWLHIRGHRSFWLPSVVTYTLFPFTLLILAYISHPSTSPVLYVAVLLLNGFFTGAALNYTLAHLLFLVPTTLHPIAISVTATFRGFAGSFGSAVGGGIFMRILRRSLDAGFHALAPDADPADKEQLIRRLLGSPALVQQLEGKEKMIAIIGYEEGLKGLFLAAAGLAGLMVFIQAATGWKGGDAGLEESQAEEENRARSRDEEA